MTKITKEDILKNRFIKIVEKENPNPNCPGKTRYFRIITPSREKAERFFFFKTLCIYAGVEALRKRDIEGAVKTANYWLEKGNKAELWKLSFLKLKILHLILCSNDKNIILFIKR